MQRHTQIEYTPYLTELFGSQYFGYLTYLLVKAINEGASTIFCIRCNLPSIWRDTPSMLEHSS